MKKRIILIDNELKLIDYVLNDTDWIVEVLVSIHKEQRYMNNDRIINIYSEEDFWNNRNLEEFDYKDLEFLWKAQLKIENTYNRFSTDFQMGKWNYYRGYALVKQIFQAHNVDFVIVKGHNHGYAWDRLITEYATSLNITSYNIEAMLNEKRVVYDNKQKKILPIGDNKVNLDSMLFYHQELDNKNRYGNDMWGKIYEWVYNHYGALGLDIVKCLRYKNEGQDRFGNTIKDRIHIFRKIRKVKKLYDEISVELDTTKKYICFGLHFEPEAVVAGRADMDSQLVAIQMLSNHLPEGWLLYVKEHPLQFSLNHANMYSYLHGVGVYKTMEVYKEISKMRNVKMLKIDSNSKTVIQHCQAIATMSGTIAAEAALYKKPALIFSAERTIYKYVDGYFLISSDETCKNAIKSILEKEEVAYNNYDEICNKYLIDFSDELKGFRKSIHVIKDEVSRREK